MLLLASLFCFAPSQKRAANAEATVSLLKQELKSLQVCMSIHASSYTCIELYMHQVIHASSYTCIKLYMHQVIHASSYTCIKLYMHQVEIVEIRPYAHFGTHNFAVYKTHLYHMPKNPISWILSPHYHCFSPAISLPVTRCSSRRLMHRVSTDTTKRLSPESETRPRMPRDSSQWQPWLLISQSGRVSPCYNIYPSCVSTQGVVVRS